MATVYAVNDVQLSVREIGSGDPLVLVHGSLDDCRTWSPIEELLARRYRVISYDRRGHGGSADGTAPGLRRDDEDDLAELIRTLDLPPATVIGNSFGASIALGLAARSPGVIGILCAHEPPLLDLAPDDPTVADARRSLEIIRERIERGDTDGAVEDFIDNTILGPGSWEAMEPEDRAAVTAAADTFAEELRDPTWASIDASAWDPDATALLLTRSDRSPPFLTSINRRLAATIGTAVVQDLPGAGHVPHLTHPDAYASVIGRFVTAPDPRRRPEPA